LQFQLIEQPRPFRRRAVLAVLQLGDGEFQIGDFGVEGVRTRFRLIGAFRGGDHHRLERGNIIRQ
jgi:hypothetical protein